MNVTYEPPQWSRGGPANAPEWNWDATDERKADALARIAKALEALAARKPNPRIVIVPVPGGKVVITDDSVEFYGTQSLDSHDYAPFPAFSLDFDNFDRLIAGYNAYTSTEG